MISVGLASIASNTCDFRKAVHGENTLPVLCIGHRGGSLPLFLPTREQRRRAGSRGADQRPGSRGTNQGAEASTSDLGAEATSEPESRGDQRPEATSEPVSRGDQRAEVPTDQRPGSRGTDRPGSGGARVRRRRDAGRPGRRREDDDQGRG
ncbi:hypothetical protein Syun_003467 [Stephania yunnanensis]|uniref:Uncharacterized protein n=1 Tax=Stephania yunnanensis TaxID=152371 RepID=A0AAP0Q0M4_9MAGN